MIFKTNPLISFSYRLDVKVTHMEQWACVFPNKQYSSVQDSCLCSPGTPFNLNNSTVLWLNQVNAKEEKIQAK